MLARRLLSGLQAGSSAQAEGGLQWAALACIHTSAPEQKSDWFGHVPMAKKDPILGVSESYQADPSPQKISVGVGAYRDDNGKPVVLEVVKEAEKRLTGRGDHEYLPIGGLKSFIEKSIALAYGEDAACIKEKRVAAVQTLSGTGACRLFAAFQNRFMRGTHVHLPKPTWANHMNVWRDSRCQRADYRYWQPRARALHFKGMMDDLQLAAPGDVVLLHACAHNPTGVDPTPEQWKHISNLVKEKELFPFFDMAYQGFASGDCDRDASAVRLFLEDGHNLALSQSFAKNMGLYGERVGALSFVTSSPDEASRIESQLKVLARPMYSNPPAFGARIVDLILGEPELKQQWFGEVKGMADRIISMRQALRRKLEELQPGASWQHMTDQIGMFCYSGLTKPQVDALARDHSIYMTSNGRISMAGVNSHNVERLAEAINAVRDVYEGEAPERHEPEREPEKFAAEAAS